MSDNPFPGPRPYRAGDRALFFGRGALGRRLAGSIVAHRALTLHGPSGAGKSSLMAAAVIPALVDDYDFRAVTVDRWPEGKAPIAWLVDAMVDQLALGRAPDDAEPAARLGKAVRLAEQRSGQPLLIYVDQLEQLLFPARPREDLDALLAGVAGVTGLAQRGASSLQIVLALREDYLGRFRDRARGHRQLLERAFRVGPLTAGEMAEAVCAAAREGKPPQAWAAEQMLALMIDVRAPGQAPSAEAEVQAVYAQIVCRAVWNDRAREGPASMSTIAAKPILERYLEDSLSELGPLRDAARRMLEEHLVTPEGLRTLRTEPDLREGMSRDDLATVLKSLEAAGILRANEYPGSRYFELGHDWLAKKVFELREERALADEQRRREEEQRAELARERADADARLAAEKADATQRLASSHAKTRRAVRLAALVVVAAMAVAIADVAAWLEARRARDLSVIAAAGQLTADGQTATAGRLLLEVPRLDEEAWRHVAEDTLAKGALWMTLRGHDASVKAVAWSPDGQRLASGSADGTVRVWSASGVGSPIVLGGSGSEVGFVEWSPDGRWIASAAGEGVVRVRSPDGSGAPLLLRHEKTALAAAWSPDGQRIVTVSKDLTAKVWSLRDLDHPLVLRGHLQEIVSAAWSPDGQRIATSSSDTSAMVWSLDAPDAPVVLGTPVSAGVALGPDHRGHRGHVFHARWSPDGQRVVTSSDDKTARVWSADGIGDPIVLRGHEGWVWDAEISPDGRHVVTASRDKTARVWDVDGVGDPRVLAGHWDAVRAARFGPSGTRVVTCSQDGTARVWNVDGSGQTQILWGHTSIIYDARWSLDGARIATASDDATVMLWTGRAWNMMGAVDHAVLPEANAAAWSPDRRRVVTAAGTDEHDAVVWSADGSGSPIELAHVGPVTRVAWSPDGERVAISTDRGGVRIWSADGRGLPLALFTRPAPWIHHVGWSPDGARVIASTEAGAEIAAADGSGERVLLAHPKGVSFASFAPDGRRVATACDDGRVRIWSADGHGAPTILGAHAALVSAAVWSPDGLRVLSASFDKTARIWSADGAGSPIVLPHDALVTMAAWSPDGRRVVTASTDRLVKVWDLAQAADPLYLPTVLRHEDIPTAIAFDGDDRVLTVSQRVARAWDLDPSKLAQQLRDVNHDCLLPRARRRYLDEGAKGARRAYEACERAHGRVPLAEEPR